MDNYKIITNVLETSKEEPFLPHLAHKMIKAAQYMKSLLVNSMAGVFGYFRCSNQYWGQKIQSSRLPEIRVRYLR